MTNRINQKMVKSKLVALSSVLPKDYILTHGNSGGIWNFEIIQQDKGGYCKTIVSSYSGTISETYHTITVLYDTVRNLNNKEIEN
jgi:hypothetical protein